LIVGRVPGRLFDRIEGVLAPTDLTIEPLIYSPEESDVMGAEGNPLVVGVLEAGVRLL